ncbi:MAG: hypothetical protein H0T42_09045 [Deltaproteobacteria bacterium]|nr:hypothetical protein [Deltaproteobacteria bacterium]
MIRIVLLACLAVASGCKSKTKAPDQGPTANEPAKPKPVEPAKPAGTPPPTGEVPVLRWTDSDGELLLASGVGNKLEGPCGLSGTISTTEVELGSGTKQTWTQIERTGNKFSLPRLDWVIEVSPEGTVTHKRGGTETQLGVVKGIDGDDKKLAWFGALVIAAPLIQHKVGIESLDGKAKLYVQGAADLRAWDVRSETGERIAHKLRDDPRPVFATKAPFDQSKVTVSRDAGKTYFVDVQRDDDALKAAFTGDRSTVIEQDGGVLALQDDKKKLKPFARLTGRAACRAHDHAVTALLWVYLGTDGLTKRLATAGPTK